MNISKTESTYIYNGPEIIIVTIDLTNDKIACKYRNFTKPNLR